MINKERAGGLERNVDGQRDENKEAGRIADNLDAQEGGDGWEN